MTNRIKLITGDAFEQARRAELERLTGCPIHHVIDGVCREPGCQNAALQLQKELVLSEEDCLRLRDVALNEGGVHLSGLVTSTTKDTSWTEQVMYTKDAAPIFQTKPRLRCVL